MYDLSILIPARHEEWLSETVNNILKQKRGKTEIIVGLDGTWAEPGVVDHDDVRVVYVPESIGQRGMGNALAKLSRAKYVAKTDAHCAFDEGFDVKLMDAMKGHDDWTIAPAMKNLCAFNWVCDHCGMRFYQGGKPDVCPSESCTFEEQIFHKEVVFEPRTKENSLSSWGTPTATGYRFTPDQLQFKYFNYLKGYFKDEITETMSLQGSFFMCTREKYWELNINDDSWGGWGQQGSEVALKTWLSGGQVMIHRGTWYAHMFRTNDQLAFPWNTGIKESRGQQQHRSREQCADLFKNNAWDKQVRGLSWLIEHFWEPLQKEGYNSKEQEDRPWTQEDLDKLKLTEGRFQPDYVKPHKGILYLTDNELPLKYARLCQKAIREIVKQKGYELVSSSRKPMDKMGKNVVTKGKRGYETMFRQILKGLETLTSDIVFIAEHDVLYPPEHFEFNPPDDCVYYDVNWVKWHEDGYMVSWEADQVSGICAPREVLLDWYRQKVKSYDDKTFDRKFEPFSGEGSKQWKADRPHIDIRHGKNLTYNKKSLDDFRKKDTAVNFRVVTEIPGWENLSELI